MKETWDAINFTWRNGTASQPQWRWLTINELRRRLPDAAGVMVRLAPSDVDDDTLNGDE